MKRILAQLLGLLALSLTPVMAVPIQVWQFNGTCTDCPGTGTATLTVEQSAFTFSYSSAWISYTLQNALVAVDEVPQMAGSPLPDLTAASVYIQGSGLVTSFGGTNGQYSNPLPAGTSTRTMTFSASPSGNWGTGEVVLADYGSGYTWAQGQSAVPEPSSLVLLGGALLAGGLARRRRLAQ